MDKNAVKVHIYMLIKNHIKVIGKTMKKMDQELCYIKTEISFMENGEME